jgi:membrane-associated phospholipid phosphatase
MRRDLAYQIRLTRASAWLSSDSPTHAVNRDRATLSPASTLYGKALPHNQLGEVDSEAWRLMESALSSGKEADFRKIPMDSVVRLSDPQGAFAFELEGADPRDFAVKPCPSFSSTEQAAEMAELYWRALSRDVPFTQYKESPAIAQAADDLNRFSEFRGSARASVSAETVFRGLAPGDTVGPYVSQFLWKDLPLGTTLLKQRYRTTVPGSDYLTNYEEWLGIQRGGLPVRPALYDLTPRYIRNGRDLAMWVYRDFTYQAFLNAALMLLTFGRRSLEQHNPFRESVELSGFVTYGPAQVTDWVARVANAALKACWFQKWMLHMRLRPEEFGGRVHNHVAGVAAYPIHADLLNSAALQVVFKQNKSYLLPVAFPEGSPSHPSYPAGHAAIAGACVTVLKALFDESTIIPDPVVPSEDGTTLLPYTGPALTVGNELHKLASNITLARDFAGIHYRSDGSEGLRLGEQVAIGVLKDLIWTLPQDSAELSFTSFDGQSVTIRKA